MPASSSPKLTDTQLVILSRAAQHADGQIAMPDHLRGGAVDRVVNSLVRQGLIREVDTPTPIGQPEPSGLLAYAITRQGLVAIGLEPAGASQGDDEASERREGASVTTARALTSEDDIATQTPFKAPKRGRLPSKRSAVLMLMRAEEGASIETIIDATGWQAHTIRAVISGLRKRGLDVERLRDQADTTRYRIVENGVPENGTASASGSGE